MKQVTTATVKLWGTDIGYVSMGEKERFARFEYAPAFVEMGIEPAPFMMPLQARRVYQFSDLHHRSFYGLPGMLADSLPDKFGNRLIDVWLAQGGRQPQDFNAVDRLCYTGTRGMGALEYEPAAGKEETADRPLEISQLVELASIAFARKETLNTQLGKSGGKDAILDILSVGTSAGGARAKAVIAFNPQNNQVRSGQINLPEGFEHWLIKFDGVEFNGDWGVSDPAGYGLVEYAYYQLAQRCGITMMESRLFAENGRSHFMTRRFDRDALGKKKFVQTLAALAHYDYWESGAYSYEQVFMLMKKLRLTKAELEEQLRRTIFNVVACNQDDHVKNISIIMDRSGKWELSPAYDLCHAQGSDFTKNHQLSINGKTGGFTLQDLKALSDYAGLPRNTEKRILQEVLSAFSAWPELAARLGVPDNLIAHIGATLRLDW